MSSDSSSLTQDVCGSIGESMSSAKSSRLQDLSCLTRESMCFDVSAQSQKVCGSIGKSMSSNESSR